MTPEQRKHFEYMRNATSDEDEEFNRIERESRIKQENVRSLWRKRRDIDEPVAYGMRDKQGNVYDCHPEQYGDYTIPLYAAPTFAEYSNVCLEVAKLQERIVALESANSLRNEVIEEVAKAIDKFVFPFGTDTVASFAVYVRSMKS